MKKNTFFPFLFLFFVCAVFFYKTWIMGFVPFPGDLLAGEFFPYKTISHNGYPPGGIPNKAQGSDVIRQMYPWKSFAIDQIKQGNVPFWNPYNFSGNPLMANVQSGVFYPLNIIFLIIPFVQAWTIYIFLIPLLSSFFMYLLLREFKISKASSIFSGIVFAFSSYMVVWMEWGNVGHTFLWLPLILFFTEKIVNKNTIKNFYLFILAFVFSILAGYMQGYFYILLTIVVYFFVRSIQEKNFSWKKFGIFSGIIFLSVAITLFQILPAIEIFSLSARNNYSLSDITRILSPVWYAITVIAPDFFGNPASRNFWFQGTYIERVSYFGLIPFIFAILAIVNYRKNKQIRFFCCLFILSLVLSLDFFFNRFIYLLPIPFISTTIPSRILSLFVFSGSVLCAFGFDMFMLQKEKKKLILAAGFVFFAFIAALSSTLFLDKTDAVISRRNLILPFALFLSFAIIFLSQSFLKKRFEKLMIVCIFFLTIFDLFYFFQKITPFSTKDYIYPKTDVFKFISQNAGYNRVWGYGSGYIQSNTQTYEKIFSTDGYDPLHILRYGELISASETGRMPMVTPRSDAVINGGYNNADDFKQNVYRQTLLNLLGVKYIIIQGIDLSPEDSYKLAYQEKDIKIYENKKAMPRVFLVSDYEVIFDKEKIIHSLFADSLVNKGEKIILEEKPAISSMQQEGSGYARIIIYEPNTVIIETKSDKDSMLFLSDTYYPGWHVRIDGKEDTIYRANYAFRAVEVTKGNHKVVFSYEPKNFRLGVAFSAISIVCSIVGLIYLKYRKIRI